VTDLLRFARRYMVPFLPWYVLGTLALLGTNALSVTIPLYLAAGVDALAQGEAGRDEVLTNALIVAAMGLLVVLIRTASRVAYFTPGRLVEAQLKRDLFEAILHHQPSFLRTWTTGDLFSRVSSDVNMVRLLAGFGVLTAVNAAIALVMAGGQMVRLSPELAIWLLGPIVVALVVVQLAIRWMFELMRILQEQLAQLSGTALATYKGVATVQAFVAEEAFQQRFDELNERYLRTTLQRSQLRSGLGPVLDLAAALDVFLLLYIGGPMVVEGRLTVGELVAFTALVGFVVLPLRTSSFLLSIIKQAQAALERIDVILQTPPDRPELPSPAPAPGEAPALRLRNLSFSYPGSDRPALEGITLDLPAGATLGVLGLTGSGKTTLLHCLARLYNPPRGTVLVDGVDLLDLDLDEWRDALTLVSQRPFLFSESVRDNILLGREEPATLERALDLAALRPDIEALPEGVQTRVGESGVRLSGGQRQRTALARGLIRPHQVLLLDDVLSAVDHATEAQLIHTLRRSDRRTTTILVAHRVSALQHADLVLVLQGGRQVDLAPPAVLRERAGPYRDTWRQQQHEVAS
jgi:ATP-binding cassette subfamily B multidrug efflux pump